MVREALRERFLDVLGQCGGSAGNTKLRAELGWQDDTYWGVHAALVEAGVIRPGRGRGGSVALVDGTAAPSAAAPVLPGLEPAPSAAVAAPRAEPRRNGNGGSRFEQTFKNIDDVLWKEAGCTTELDYTEQTSWMLFLKYLDDLEHDGDEAELRGQAYRLIIDTPHRW